VALRLRLFRLLFGAKGHSRSFLLISGTILSAAAALAVSGLPTYALVPALAGFGLCLTALLHALFPPLASWMDGLPRRLALGMWALLVLPLALLGFSSTAVIVLVLFSGGFMMGIVLWRVLSRLSGYGREDTQSEMGRDGRAIMVAIVVLATGSLVGSFLLGYYRLHESGAIGVAITFGNGGMLLGIMPSIGRLLGVSGRSGDHPGHLLGPLLRDVAFAAIVAGVVGYEISLAAEGTGALSSVPTFVLVIVLVGYLGVLARSLISVGRKLEPRNPLLVASFGMILLYVPLVVILSNPPATVARLYGAAQAAGLLAVTVYIGMARQWQEEIQRFSNRLQEAINKGISVKVTIGAPEEDPGEDKAEKRGFFRRQRKHSKGG
jgi:hypothetical protein